MKRLILLVILIGAAVLAPSAGASLAVKLDQSSVSTRIGEKFRFSSTVRNLGPQPVPDVVAHLNIVSLDPSVYVDPEDWSSHRTLYLHPIPAGGSITSTWRVEAVNDGSFGVYVAVLPASGAATSPTTSPTVHLLVAQKKTLNSGGIVPLALGLPGLLGVLALSVRIRRGRASRAA